MFAGEFPMPSGILRDALDRSGPGMAACTTLCLGRVIGKGHHCIALADEGGRAHLAESAKRVKHCLVSAAMAIGRGSLKTSKAIWMCQAGNSVLRSSSAKCHQLTMQAKQRTTISPEWDHISAGARARALPWQVSLREEMRMGKSAQSKQGAPHPRSG